jgi:hypothetical protein
MGQQRRAEPADIRLVLAGIFVGKFVLLREFHRFLPFEAAGALGGSRGACYQTFHAPFVNAAATKIHRLWPRARTFATC